MTQKLRVHNLIEILRGVLQQMRDGELALVASSLAFSTAMALVPFLAVVLATFQSIGGLEALYPKVEMLLLRNLTEAVGSDVTKFIRIFIKNINAGKLGTTGAIFLFITSIRLLHDMEVGVNRVWNQRTTRPFYKRLMYQWGLMLAIPILLAVYFGFLSMEQLKFVRSYVPPSASNSLLLIGILFFTYKVVPDANVRSKYAFWSAILSAGVLYVVHKSYSLLAVKFFSYNKIYGSFAAIPMLLIWILTMWYVILGGVALSAALQKRLEEMDETNRVLGEK